MKKIFKIFSITIILLFVTAFSTSFAIENEKSENYSYKELQKAIEDRSFLGLESSESYTKSILEKKNDRNSVFEFGMYLTKEEADNLNKRFEHHNEYIPKVLNYIETNVDPDLFAGSYIDQKADGILYIGLVKNKNTERIQKQLEKIYVQDDKINFYFTEYSLKELEELHQKINQDISELEKFDIIVNRVETDEINNRVNIGIKDVNSSKIKYLKERYGEPIHIFEDESNYEPTGTAGGVEIRPEGCSTGFSARRGSTYFIVTAGHCSNGYYSQSWYLANGVFLGTMYIDDVKVGGSVDAGLITVSPSKTDSRVYYNGRFLTLRGFYNNGGPVNMRVCNAGFKTNKCGYITNNSVSAHYDNHPSLYNLIETSIYTDRGDSGGPLFTEGTTNYLVGISSGRFPKRQTSIFTKISPIINEFNITPITN